MLKLSSLILTISAVGLVIIGVVEVMAIIIVNHKSCCLSSYSSYVDVVGMIIIIIYAEGIYCVRTKSLIRK